MVLKFFTFLLKNGYIISTEFAYQIRVLIAESWIDPRYNVARCDTCGMMSSIQDIKQQNPWVSTDLNAALKGINIGIDINGYKEKCNSL